MGEMVVPAGSLLDIPFQDGNALIGGPPQIRHDRSRVLPEIALNPQRRDFEIHRQRSLRGDPRCLAAALTRSGMIGLTSVPVDSDADAG